MISGRDIGSLRDTGRGVFMGQRCTMVNGFSEPSGSRSFIITSFTLCFPFGAVQTTSPEISGGTMHLWVISGVSGQVQYTAPPESLSPDFTVTVTSNSRPSSREGIALPSATKAPAVFVMSRSGRSIPSKIFEIMPGPRAAQTGAPDGTTGSPIRSPEVFSYT